MNTMKYPNKVDVETADHKTLCIWYRFLSSPMNNKEVVIMNMIVKKVDAMGGFTPEISKSIGWG